MDDQDNLDQYIYPKSSFLTENELNFYFQLQESLKWKDFLLFANVRLADIFWVKNVRFDPKAFWVFNTIKSKHIDFVITDISWKIKLCIELDDSTHDVKRKGNNDKFKDDLFAMQNIPLKRCRVDDKYEFEF